ncbi:hypothetical protein CMV_013053 [Castanea mollissima]|uniref:Uncharacterized protein n=1 Tax=Castanea mollissima TaxID=60419 RepID=A0A8J4R2D4_9ROSI|nr:hypothetical protein CMV_013053 [Castanea mollissima]
MQYDDLYSDDDEEDLYSDDDEEESDDVVEVDKIENSNHEEDDRAGFEEAPEATNAEDSSIFTFTAARDANEEVRVRRFRRMMLGLARAECVVDVRVESLSSPYHDEVQTSVKQTDNKSKVLKWTRFLKTTEELVDDRN